MSLSELPDAVMAAGAVQLSDVSKRYELQRRSTVISALRSGPRPTRMALRGIDLTIAPGEAVGVLGHNGAGKTTLLRLLAGVSRPSTGHVIVRGRIAPLISVGVGFHQELSGRENVFMNGQLLGLSQAELRHHLPSIVEFSELDGVLDTPIKFYSSGMLLRLAFSVLVHLQPDVMLVDEILAVGDVSFQAKCLRRLRAMWESGATLLLVSHHPNVIRALCPRTLVMHQGQLVFDGPSEQAIWAYHELLGRDDAPTLGTTAAAAAEIADARLIGPDDAPATVIEVNRRYRLHHRVRFHETVESPQVYFHVFDDSGELVYERISTVGTRHRTYGPGQETTVEIAFTAGIGSGRYRLVTEIRSLDGRTVICHDGPGVAVERRSTGAVGAAELDASIEVSSTPAEPVATS